MSTTIHKQKSPTGVPVDPNIPDFSKSPFVIKKVEKARATIAKYGLPKEETPKRK